MSDSHILITRFNVQYWDSPEPSDQWLQQRIELFRRYTVPSVRSQTTMPDTWLVLCGKMPTWLGEEFEAIRTEIPILRVRRLSEAYSPEVAAAAVTAEVPGDADRLITTRVDNDDALAPDFLETVRAAAADRIGVFLNFPHGLLLSSGRLYCLSDPSNQFISLIEPADSPKTVLVDKHQLLDRYGPIVQIAEPDMWIQVLHGGNLSNNTVRGVRTDARRVTTRFAADLEIESSSRLSQVLDRAYTGMRTTGRVLSSGRRLRKAWKVFRAP